MTQLKLHNTLGRTKQEFIPINPNHIRIYVCGPTVYDYAHIGNARPAVVFDAMVRLLRALYPKVTYARNITDVDDKIMARAHETGENISDITKKYTQIYHEDMGALGVEKPDAEPRATDHIPEMVAMIKALMEKGHAYENEGHVLFHVPSFTKYGQLSGRNREEMIAGARIDVAPYKKDPADFVLWKPSTNDQPGWDSPWGFGRPGWHLECSAMTKAHLGEHFDIHGGGLDLTFPHHENEIAQSCGAHGHDHFANYWVHNGFVTVEGEKMSKSLGNVLLVHDLLQQAPGEAIRLALLSSHYRQPFDWTATGLKQARNTLDRLYHILRDVQDVAPIADEISSPVLDALCDDLNTPQAIAELNALARHLAKADSLKEKATLKTQILCAGKIMGLFQQDPEEWFQSGTANQNVDAVEVENLIKQRNQARADKDFAKADAIRDQLANKGITIEDGPEGTSWRMSG